MADRLMSSNEKFIIIYFSGNEIVVDFFFLFFLFGNKKSYSVFLDLVLFGSIRAIQYKIINFSHPQMSKTF